MITNRNQAKFSRLLKKIKLLSRLRFLEEELISVATIAKLFLKVA